MNDEYNKEVRRLYGRWLRQLREDKGLTQKELGERLGIEDTTISKIEAGKWNFGVDTLTLFARELGFYVFFLEKDSKDELAEMMRNRWNQTHQDN